ncbi:protein HEXIM1-like [Acipenser ruthenus]|uniref:protein HEXIM1-like n=1 Tax=Acipenser ruthenus TaxID=7906 RepID=UPI00145A8E96|nr:protein HEXIM1-like [Acipenser ruthenus]
MSDPASGQDDRHHPKTPGPRASGSGTAREPPRANEDGCMESGARGRSGEDHSNSQPQALGDREASPGRGAGKVQPRYPAAAQPCQAPGGDAGGTDVPVEHGRSGDRPGEGNRSQVRGESGVAVRRVNHGCPGGGGGGVQSLPGKKKHRRRPSKKKRRWKPYFKLSWEEKKELDERETARASRVREEMFAKGLPVAPYNTTQFLMEEHDREEPDLKTELGARRPVGVSRSEDTASEEESVEPEEEEDGSGGSDGMGRAGDGGGEFLQRDFSETYEKYHAESLQSKSKQELVREYLELEKCLSRLEDENNRLRLRLSKSGDSPAAESPRVRELEGELERLRALNTELSTENEGWRRGERGLAGSTAE